MAVILTNYVLKPGNIQVLPFTGTTEELTEIYDWLVGVLPVGSTVTLNTTYKNIRWQIPGGPEIVVTYNKYIVVDTNGKVYRMEDPVLSALFDPAP